MSFGGAFVEKLGTDDTLRVDHKGTGIGNARLLALGLLVEQVESLDDSAVSIRE
jgi:hypothetical protein